MMREGWIKEAQNTKEAPDADVEEIRIAITGEGPTDYGSSRYDEGKGTNVWDGGPLFPLIMNTAERFGKNVCLIAVDKQDVLNMRSQRSFKRLNSLHGKANDSARFSLYLAMHGHTYGIFYCDTDKEPKKRNTDRRVCEALFKRVYGEVMAGLEAAGTAGLTIIPMISLKMIECWLLSDGDAYKKAFGIQNPQLPASPELIWGDDEDPGSDYPKHYMQRVLKQMMGKAAGPNRHVFLQIAEQTSVDVLRVRCGISFQKFYEDFGLLLSP